MDQCAQDSEERFAGQILHLALIEARNLGIREALLSCDADNFASRRVIESHGGVPEALNSQGTVTKAKLRYWITTRTARTSLALARRCVR